MTKQELIEHAARLHAQQASEMVAVNTRLPRDLRDQLRAYASGRGLTLQAAIEKAVADLLREQGQ